MTTIQKTKPDIVVQTNPTIGSCVDCKVAQRISVTYEIRPAGGDSTKLSGLPYAIAINNLVPNRYQKLPATAEKSTPVVTFYMHVGFKANLFLGSDAKAIYRKVPLYEVTAGENNIRVIIQEKHGKHPTDTDKPVFVETKNHEDIYHAPLTGDIWMKFSHMFTSSEVDELMPDSISPVARKAVKDIYDGKFDGGTATTLTIPFEHPLKLIWTSVKNAHDNISHFDERKDIHTRVNPRTYAALIQAAEHAKIDEIHLSSGWRPMIGSVLHRIGLGLDVKVIVKDKKSTAVNRDSILLKKLQHAENELKAANQANDPEKIEVAKAKVTAMKKDYEANIKKEAEATDPTDVALFRAELANAKDIVKQIFDPWKMDKNASDNKPADPNILETPNEKLHGNHLHITAVDAGLGYPSSHEKASMKEYK